jgi:H-NS histone family
MTSWEYMKVMLNEASRRGDEIDLLCDAGAEGWELVAVLPNGVAYLKREIFQEEVANPQSLNGSEAVSHVRPKYRDRTTGETWSGRGRMASWLKRKVDAGEDPEKYLI